MSHRSVRALLALLFVPTALVGSTSLGASAQAADQRSVGRPEVARVVRIFDGELVQVRRGDAPPYVVRIAGIDVPSSSCEQRAAKQNLRKTLKVGTTVLVVANGRGPDRVDGFRSRFLAVQAKKRIVSVGLTLIALGFADADRSIDYPFKAKYKRVQRASTTAGLGYHGTCA